MLVLRIYTVTSFRVPFSLFCHGSKQQCEKYFKEVEAMNVWEVLNKAIENTSDTLEGTAGKENIGRIRELATSWFKNELDEWDKKLEEQIRMTLDL